MAKKSEGMTYAPKGKAGAVVKKGEFVFAAAALDHGHIYGMCNGLTEAGADLKWVWDPDPKKVKDFCAKFPQAKKARSLDEILGDGEVQLVAGAAVTSERCPLGLKALAAGKHYFTDKAPLVSLEQLKAAKAAVKKSGKKYMCYYSERLHVESAIYAGNLIADGAVGKVIQVIGMGPHRMGPPKSRPDWFFIHEKYGGILCDIGSHQIEQFLFYTGAKDATVASSRVANFNHPKFPELEDFGDASLTGDNGAAGYFRVDWFNPDGLAAWGDGRTFILGTEGYIELRKYINVGVPKSGGDHLFIVNNKEEKYIDCKGKTGFPYFGALILDCLNGTEKAMTQEHCFKAAELCVKAQMKAVKIK